MIIVGDERVEVIQAVIASLKFLHSNNMLLKLSRRNFVNAY